MTILSTRLAVLVTCVLAVAGGVLTTAAGSAQAVKPSTIRASISSKGKQANADNFMPALSRDGRYSVFTSNAALVAEDTNGIEDVYVHDRKTGKTHRVSVSTSGAQGNNFSFDAHISDDGRYVAFTSDATNLVPGDTNGVQDTFLRDLKNNVTHRVSLNAAKGQINGTSYYPTLSGNGRYLSFESEGSNVVDGVPADQIYRRDLKTGKIVVVSRTSTGEPSQGGDVHSARISADGRFVSFEAWSQKLAPNDVNDGIDIYLRDIVKHTTTLVSVARPSAVISQDPSWSSALSDNGRFVVFQSDNNTLVPKDTNITTDVFLRDVTKGKTYRLNVAADGGQGNVAAGWADISANGRYIVFSNGNTLPGVRGIYIGIPQIAIKDRITGSLKVASVGNNVKKAPYANKDCGHGAISADGTSVAFYSYGTNLVSGDTNNQVDVFVHRLR